MALILADRVLETSTSEGLGTFALAGAQTGYQTFSSGIGNGNTCYYTINGQTTEQWEVGIGTVGAGTLARTTLISSNTGSFINFVAGVKNVFVTQPASKSIYKDENGNAIPLGSASATQLDITAQGDLRLQDTTGGQYVALQAPSTIATSYTLTMPADDGTAGQALVTDGSGVLSWSSAASGDVYGPASATDNAVARYDGTTGKIIQNSAVTIGDDGATVIDVNSTSAGLRITQIGTGNALLVEDAANPDATPFVIDNSGNAIQGNTTFNTIGSLSIGGFQAQQNSSGAVGTSVISYGTAAAAYARAAFARSPSGVIGTNAAVAINNALMELVAYGHDGTAFIPAASIQANVDGTPGTNDMPGRLVFSTTADGASSPTERMRIDSAGNVGVGTTAQAFEKLVLAGTFPSGSANTRANVVRGTIPSSTTSLFNGFRTEPTTQAASFTLAAMTHFSANQGTLGAGSAVTNQYGFIAESNLTGATNNYGFLGNIPSGTGRWNFYAAGTAANYFEGNVGLGVTPSAWAGNSKPLQSADASFWGSTSLTGYASIGGNYFYDGTYKYIKSSTATDYYQYQGAHVWRTASSGTAGNPVSFTQVMSLDANGNLIVGGTLINAATITSYASATRAGGLGIRNSAGTAAGGIYTGAAGSGSGSTDMYVEGVGLLVFTVGGSERARITSTGNVGIGTSSPSAKLSVGGSDAPKLNLLVASGAERAFIDYTEATSIMRIDSDGDISLRTNNVESIRINAFNNVGIGTASPNASAILDVQSTTKGVRMPNMTTAQKNAIASPAAGLVVYDTTLSKLCVYTTAWETITSL